MTIGYFCAILLAGMGIGGGAVYLALAKYIKTSDELIPPNCPHCYKDWGDCPVCRH